MTESALIKTVEKFDGSNFQVWKFQMNAVPIANAIQDGVTGQKVKPEDVNSADGKMWIKDDAMATCYISTSIAHSKLDCLLNCSTGKEIWDKLATIHEQKLASNKLLLLQKFHSHRMEPNESVVQHVARVPSIKIHCATNSVG